MPEFRLTNKAVEDLSNIWHYTLTAWSEKQADKYYGMIISNCQLIADSPELGKSYGRITENLLGIKSNRHIIFYRTFGVDHIEILRILHEGMDLKKRILEG